MTPEERITSYLFTNKSRVEYSTVEIVVKDVKLSLFYSMSPISDDDIRKVVVKWASIHAVGLVTRQPPGGSHGSPGQGTSPTNSDSEFVDAVKKAISTVNAGITLGKKGANVNIGVTGLTANLKMVDGSASLGLSWSGTLKLETESGPFHFSGTLSKDKWEITLSFPQDTYIPDLSSLTKVFQEGEKAVGKVAYATRSFNNISDAGKVGALIKPHVPALEEAVKAASGIAKASKKGGASFGFSLGSPTPGPGEQGMSGGIQGTIVFTYVF